MRIEIWEENQGDWIDVFVNEVRVHSDHQIQIRQVLEILRPYLKEEMIITDHIWTYNDEEYNVKRHGYYLGG